MFTILPSSLKVGVGASSPSGGSVCTPFEQLVERIADYLQENISE
jgi:hypothetical protein